MDLETPDFAYDCGKVLDRKTGITMWLRSTPEMETRVFHFLDPRWRPDPIELTGSVIAVLPDGSIQHYPAPNVGRWGVSLHLGGAPLRDYLLTLESNRGFDSPYFDDLTFDSFKRFIEPGLRILASHWITENPDEMVIHFEVWKAYDKEANELSDALADHLRAAGIAVERIEANPWLDDLVRRLPAPLPPSYAAFVRRYRFDPFRWDRLALFGTSGRHPQLDLPNLVAQGNSMWNGLLEVQLLHIGWPPKGAADPVCFDLSKRAFMNENNIVVVDGAESLRTNRVMFKTRIAGSFFLFARAMLASDLRPLRIVPA